ncbi:carboxymuconolactone decarboxylase family protein [Streptomyces rimosus]|uniref:carboxymuconolactone decarboxylase family protein n=1 Tax=Streptomyces rimosus TaxID=1927 RepID=UPI0004C9817A|nr:carboxymuconolactone decarboxylase family protein [Streptomyces rimosus]
MTTATGSARLDFYKLAPGVYQPLLNAHIAAKKGLGDPVLAELVLIRASQINHCAFCLDMHVKDAQKAGVSEERIYLLNAWEEATGHYTAKEQAALALTEAVTVLTWGSPRPEAGGGHVPDAVYERAAAHFDERELAHLIALITTINMWNRINVAIRQPIGGGA